MNESDAPLASMWCAKDLPAMPRFVETLISKAKTELGVEKIVLFGSRARGDHSPRSDYDFCFYNNPAEMWTSEQWARFVIDFDENKETLCSIDFVNASESNPTLIDEIERTGIILYERK